jgi:hypothetical protein
VQRAGLLVGELGEGLGGAHGKEPYAPPRTAGPSLRYRHADTGEAAPLEAIVRGIGDNRRSLLPHREAFAGLGATVKDPWRTTAPPPSEGVLLRGLDPAQRRSLRIEPALTLSISTDPLGRAEWDGSRLTFACGRATTGSRV